MPAFWLSARSALVHQMIVPFAARRFLTYAAAATRCGLQTGAKRVRRVDTRHGILAEAAKLAASLEFLLVPPPLLVPLPLVLVLVLVLVL